MKKILSSLLVAISLSACSGMNINDYEKNTPRLNLETYLDGKISGYGIVQDRSGNVTKQFSFKGFASWSKDQGTFTEQIIYSDGRIESRIWTFSKINDNEYQATTPDVLGKADIKVAGNAMNWKYDMNVKVNDKIYTINFDDWMFLIDEKHLINRNYFYKFGVNVGELTLYLEKND